jgi:hypothetical protein
MESKTHTVGMKVSSNSKAKNTGSEILLDNLFKPPKIDTNYFYYTEVKSDWVKRK